MITTKKGFSDWNTGKEIRIVWRNFSTWRNKLKFDKRRTTLHQIQYIIIFDFFYADRSILKPRIATQHKILNFVLAAIQITSKSRVARGNTPVLTFEKLAWASNYFVGHSGFCCCLVQKIDSCSAPNPVELENSCSLLRLLLTFDMNVQ